MKKSTPLDFFPKLFIFAFFLLSSSLINAQIGINTTDPKAMLDVESDHSGILIPRVALTSIDQSTPVVSPQVSELVYNTATAGTAPNNVSPGYYYWNGNQWVRLSSGAATVSNEAWELSGNAGTTAGTNFIGTTDHQALHFKTNDQTRLILPTANQVYGITGGSAEAPFYSFEGRSGTGMFSLSNVTLGLTTNSIERFRVGNGFIWSYFPHRFPDGAAGTPAIQFESNRNTGIFKPANFSIGFSAKGEERMRVNPTGVEIDGSLSLKEGPQLSVQTGMNILNPSSTGATFSQYRLVGSGGAFSIGGITPLEASDGQLITLINTTGHPLTLVHNHTGVNADLRIYTPNETNFIITGRYATVTLQYNRTLQKWVITDFVSSGIAESPVKSVKGTTDISMNSSVFTDMQGMTLTFTPKNPVVYVSFGASGYMDVGTSQNPDIPEGGGVSFRLYNVTSNRIEAGVSSVATDYNSDGLYEGVITAWNVGLNMFPISVTPGVETTIKIQWSRDAVYNARPIHCFPATDPGGSHRNLTVLDL